MRTPIGGGLVIIPFESIFIHYVLVISSFVKYLIIEECSGEASVLPSRPIPLAPELLAAEQRIEKVLLSGLSPPLLSISPWVRNIRRRHGRAARGAAMGRSREWGRSPRCIDGAAGKLRQRGPAIVIRHRHAIRAIIAPKPAGERLRRHALMRGAHKARPDFYGKIAAGRFLCRRIIVVAEPDPGDEMAGIADEPRIAQILAGAGFPRRLPARHRSLARRAR